MEIVNQNTALVNAKNTEFCGNAVKKVVENQTLTKNVEKKFFYAPPKASEFAKPNSTLFFDFLATLFVALPNQHLATSRNEGKRTVNRALPSKQNEKLFEVAENPKENVFDFTRETAQSKGIVRYKMPEMAMAFELLAKSNGAFYRALPHALLFVFDKVLNARRQGQTSIAISRAELISAGFWNEAKGAGDLFKAIKIIFEATQFSLTDKRKRKDKRQSEAVSGYLFKEIAVDRGRIVFEVDLQKPVFKAFFANPQNLPRALLATTTARQIRAACILAGNRKQGGKKFALKNFLALAGYSIDSVKQCHGKRLLSTVEKDFETLESMLPFWLDFETNAGGSPLKTSRLLNEGNVILTDKPLSLTEIKAELGAQTPDFEAQAANDSQILEPAQKMNANPVTIHTEILATPKRDFDNANGECIKPERLFVEPALEPAQSATAGENAVENAVENERKTTRMAIFAATQKDNFENPKGNSPPFAEPENTLTIRIFCEYKGIFVGVVKHSSEHLTEPPKEKGFGFFGKVAHAFATAATNIVGGKK